MRSRSSVKKPALVLSLLLLPLVAAGAAWESRAILPGTGFASRWYLLDSGKPGPRVLLFAPHADERSAGLFLQRLVETRTITNGLLLVCPIPVAPAWEQERRFVIEDLNRQFGPASPANRTPIDLIARMVRSWIEEYRFDWLLNVHEGWFKFADDWHNYGEGLIIDDAALIPFCRRIVERVNAEREVAAEDRFLVAYKPMANTLTFHGYARGVRSIGIEVARELPLSRKLRYQELLAEAFFQEIGMALLRR